MPEVHTMSWKWEKDDDEPDPRRELVKQLLEYRRYKAAAQKLEEAADFYKRSVDASRVPQSVATAALSVIWICWLVSSIPMTVVWFDASAVEKRISVSLPVPKATSTPSTIIRSPDSVDVPETVTVLSLGSLVAVATLINVPEPTPSHVERTTRPEV